MLVMNRVHFGGFKIHLFFVILVFVLTYFSLIVKSRLIGNESIALPIVQSGLLFQVLIRIS